MIARELNEVQVNFHSEMDLAQTQRVVVRLCVTKRRLKVSWEAFFILSSNLLTQLRLLYFLLRRKKSRVAGAWEKSLTEIKKIKWKWIVTWPQRGASAFPYPCTLLVCLKVVRFGPVWCCTEVFGVGVLHVVRTMNCLSKVCFSWILLTLKYALIWFVRRTVPH